MKHISILVMAAILLIITACHKDNEDNGNLLGAWQVVSSTWTEYDLDGNIQNTWDGGEFTFTYIDINDEGRPDYYQYNVSAGDNWVFVDDTTVHIKEKTLAYHHFNLDDVPYIRLDAPNMKYRIEVLSKNILKLKYLEIWEGNHSFKQEIIFTKL